MSTSRGREQSVKIESLACLHPYVSPSLDIYTGASELNLVWDNSISSENLYVSNPKMYRDLKRKLFFILFKNFMFY